jgi:hypothetical protein
VVNVERLVAESNHAIIHTCSRLYRAGVMPKIWQSPETDEIFLESCIRINIVSIL